MKNLYLFTLKAGKVTEWGKSTNVNAGRPLKGLRYQYTGRGQQRFWHRLNNLKPKEGWTYLFKVIGDQKDIFNEGWYPTIKELKYNVKICLAQENLELLMS